MAGYLKRHTSSVALIRRSDVRAVGFVTWPVETFSDRPSNMKFCRSFSLRTGCLVIASLMLLCLTLTVMAISLSQPSPGTSRQFEIYVNGVVSRGEYHGIPAPFLMAYSSVLATYALSVVLMIFGAANGRRFLLAPWLVINALATTGALSTFIFTCCFDMDSDRLINSASMFAAFFWFGYIVCSHFHQLSSRPSPAQDEPIDEKLDP